TYEVYRHSMSGRCWGFAVEADPGNGRAKSLKNFTSASGCVSTLASFTTLPVASTMHTLESSKETVDCGIVVHGLSPKWVAMLGARWSNIQGPRSPSLTGRQPPFP